jgi:hypothetical protein
MKVLWFHVYAFLADLYLDLALPTTANNPKNVSCEQVAGALLSACGLDVPEVLKPVAGYLLEMATDRLLAWIVLR